MSLPWEGSLGWLTNSTFSHRKSWWRQIHSEVYWRKEAAFQWLPEHEATFVEAKQSLVHHVRLHHFDRNLCTCLVTDASRLHGLGFMLLQPGPLAGLCHIIKCRFRSIKPAKANYTTIELECLVIQWVVEKCQYFLRGCGNFSIQTDHQPLNSRQHNVVHRTHGTCFSRPFPSW